MKYIFKPIEIEAWVIKDLIAMDKGKLPGRVKQGLNNREVIFISNGIMINGSDGNTYGAPEDMLIQGTEGELYPCRKEKFFKIHKRI